jgi:hypothetical protein
MRVRSAAAVPAAEQETKNSYNLTTVRATGGGGGGGALTTDFFRPINELQAGVNLYRATGV